MRKVTHKSAEKARKSLIKNGKFFVAPQHNQGTFKQVFARLAASGAGRPVDPNGFPDGPWTPEKLSDAITVIEENVKGVELRAVQTWFQDNDNGISNDNICWLARIFGCDDPEMTSGWQKELIASKERLTADRRAKRQAERERKTGSINTPSMPGLPSARQSVSFPSSAFETEKNTNPPVNIARISERLFLKEGPLSATAFFWAYIACMLFIAYSIGVHDITYSPTPSVSKQVGLFWSPNWTLDRLVWIPILIFFVSNTLTLWRERWRSSLIVPESGLLVGNGWPCLLYTSPSPRDQRGSRMPSSA